ncbi:hypothetical protein M0R45_018564 [Rubus argutus]|uniref:EF-hand domain-containing protein n=1 Tax=Rubus argutus TaxID=59490 RepID=A0AAW1X476_RUBAR
MEELREVALAYYDNCNPGLRGRAWEFFRSMDADGDQRISQREFKEFLRQSGYDTIITDPDFFAKLDRNGDRGPWAGFPRKSFFQSLATNGAHQISYLVFNEFLQQRGYNWIINDPKLFEKLDRNCDGSLDFWELLTFYYIISTRYFHCRQCSGYLGGLYFTCFACFEEGAHHSHYYDPGTYNLCCACYRNKNFSHHHSYFLDNHILLRSKRGHPPYAAPHLVKYIVNLMLY